MMDVSPMRPSIGIELKITDRCNLHCFHCMNSDSQTFGSDLDVDLFLHKMSEWIHESNADDNRIGEVRITGGEPLLRPDAVMNIAKFCELHAIPCGINTNGTLLTDDMAHRLKKSGLKTVKISLDATDDKVLKTIRGSYATVKRLTTAIDAAVRHNFNVMLRFTLSRYNLEQLPSCFELATHLKVDKFQIKSLVASGRALSSKAFLSKEEIWASLSVLSNLISVSSPEVEILCWPFSLPEGMKGKACGNINKIYITTDMKLINCNYISEASPFGDLHKDSLAEILAHRLHSGGVANINGSDVFASCPQLTGGCVIS